MFVDVEGNLHTHQCAVPGGAMLSPCLFEYVYFARPDSVLDKVPVYEGEMSLPCCCSARWKVFIVLVEGTEGGNGLSGP